MFQSIGPDKVLHFLASFLIALYDPVLSLIAGLSKEFWDIASGGAADFGDIVANGMGIALALFW